MLYKKSLQQIKNIYKISFFREFQYAYSVSYLATLGIRRQHTWEVMEAAEYDKSIFLKTTHLTEN